MTKRYCVIGYPIGHSLSPPMHNMAFSVLGIDASYDALEVNDLDTKYGGLREIYSGINVTVPHKIKILDLVDEVDESADLIGAANCLDISDKTTAHNTDMVGSISALKTKAASLKNKEVLVLGAGGAARAVSFGCALEGAHVSIYNRTKMRAQTLCEEIKNKTCKETKAIYNLESAEYDILINATSIGMWPKTDESPFEYKISKDSIVMDVVYNPLETRLLRDAREVGAETVDGVEMFIYQGAESLRIWGYDPPIDAMRKEVHRILSKG